ncbi:hypothetical protein ACFL6M_03185 [Candidatus Eisenbacteria bacterium]|uniref:Uncharacterized protein n=1 Tax=Eiseniibacteriota bacterium TaxID=2212470 RepID=A0ABV6YJS2_UNCEI
MRARLLTFSVATLLAVLSSTGTASCSEVPRSARYRLEWLSPTGGSESMATARYKLKGIVRLEQRPVTRSKRFRIRPVGEPPGSSVKSFAGGWDFRYCPPRQNRLD